MQGHEKLMALLVAQVDLGQHPERLHGLCLGRAGEPGRELAHKVNRRIWMSTRDLTAPSRTESFSVVSKTVTRSPAATSRDSSISRTSASGSGSAGVKRGRSFQMFRAWRAPIPYLAASVTQLRPRARSAIRHASRLTF